jgi:hypothetical protein
LILKEGLLNFNSKIQATFGDKPNIKLESTVELNKLSVLDRFKKPIIAWDKLDVDGVVFSTTPSSLQVKKIDLIKPYLNLDIKKDKSTNFSNIIKP